MTFDVAAARQWLDNERACLALVPRGDRIEPELLGDALDRYAAALDALDERDREIARLTECLERREEYLSGYNAKLVATERQLAERDREIDKLRALYIPPVQDRCPNCGSPEHEGNACPAERLT